MEKTENKTQEFSIDLKALLRALWRRAWIILLVAALFGGVMGVYTKFFVTPKYAASVMLYVNNKNSTGSGNITASDLSAAQSLVDTYIGILNNYTTMEQVAEKSGLTYTPVMLMGMTTAQGIEGTELFTVTVTSTSAEDAAKIAASIAEVLPKRIEQIIEGSTMKVVDTPRENNNKVSPSVGRSAALAALVGATLAIGFFCVLIVLDDSIRDEDYLTQTYDLPVLAKIPNLVFEEEAGKSRYGYAGKGGKEA